MSQSPGFQSLVILPIKVQSLQTRLCQCPSTLWRFVWVTFWLSPELGSQHRTSAWTLLVSEITTSQSIASWVILYFSCWKVHVSIVCLCFGPPSSTQLFLPRVSMLFPGCITTPSGSLLWAVSLCQTDLTWFLALKPNLPVLDVFPQDPSVPKAKNSYCSLSIYCVLYMHHLSWFSQPLVIISNFRRGDQRELASYLRSYSL